MKKILLSTQPKWCEKILSRVKTIELRKAMPQASTPFKVFLYCTKEKTKGDEYWVIEPEIVYCANGSIIGEFVCDHIEQIDCSPHLFDKKLEQVSKDSCLTVEEIGSYLGYDALGQPKVGYGWHISDLVTYDSPKELSSFGKPCSLFDKRVCVSRTLCGEQKRVCDGSRRLTRPPQSWCYVEEIK